MGSSFGGSIKLSGESEYKKALKEIDSSLRVLGSEMKEVTSQFDKNDRSAENLSKQNEVLTKKISEQEAKVETLRKALQASAEETGENSEKTKRYQIQLNNAQAELNTMNRQLENNKKDMAAAEAATDDEKAAVKEMGDEVDKSSGKLEALGGVLKASVAAVAAVGAAAVAAGKKIWDMANETAEYGDEVDKMSQKLGMSAEAYQEWDYVLGQSGVDITSMSTGMKTLTNQIDAAKGGSEDAIERFKQLGISLEDLNSMSREDIFAAVVTGMQGMEDSTERAALANKLFGKSGQELTPLFNESVESTEALKNAARDYGMIMSNDAVAASAAFKDSLDTLDRTMKGAKNRMMSDLLPGLTSIIDGFSDLVAGNKTGGEQIKKGVEETIQAISDMIPQAVDLLSLLVEALADNAPALLDSLASSIIKILPNLFSKFFSDVLPKLFNSLTKMLPKLASAAVQVVRDLLSSVAKALPELMKNLSVVIVELVKVLTDPDSISALIDAGFELVEGLVSGILQALPQLFEAVFVAVGNLVASIFSIFEDRTLSIDGVVSSINEVGDAFDELNERAHSAVDSVQEKVSSLNNGFSTVDELSERLKGLLEDGTIDASEQAEAKTIVDLISEKVPDFKTTWDELVTKDSEGNLSLQNNADLTIEKIDSVIEAYKREAVQATLNSTVADLLEQQQQLEADKESALAQLNLTQGQYNEWLDSRLEEFDITEKDWKDFLSGSEIADDPVNDKLKNARMLWSEMVNEGFMSGLADTELAMNGLNIAEDELSATTEDYMSILKVLNGDYMSDMSATLEAVKLGYISQQDVVDATGLKWDEFEKKASSAVSNVDTATEKAWSNMRSVLQNGNIDWDAWGDEVAFTLGNHEYKLSELKDMTKDEFKDLSTYFNTSDWTSWGDDTSKISDEVAKAFGSARIEIGKESEQATKNIRGITGNLDRSAMKGESTQTWRDIVASFGGERGSYMTFYDIAKNSVNGLNDGFNDYYARSTLRTTEELLAKEAGDVYARINEIKSPSRKFKRMAINDIKGLIGGHDEMYDEAVASVQRIADGIASVDFAAGIFDTSSLISQFQSALPALEAEAVINASLADAIGLAGAAGGNVSPVNVTIQFGDVQLASDMDIYDVADRISDIIAANVVRVGGRFG